jgi:hypothetical protein
MDFLKSSKRRSFVSEIVYRALNIGLAVAILAVVLAIDSPLPAMVVFLFSKWRIFAVRPRYWAANIKSNMVDIIVGLSLVVLLFASNGTLYVQIIMTILYAGWLLFVKPRSKRVFVALQAGVSVFLGITALMIISYDWYATLVVAAMWVIGYSAARHVLNSYDEPHLSFFTLVWALIFAELGWLGYHWAFAYTIPGIGNIKLSQTALVGLALSFLAERIYSSYHRNDGVRLVDIVLPAILVTSVVVVVMLFFNTLNQGNI